MAGAINYAKLREQTMGSGLDEEAVTVNTRALIDKVLARYSGEWTTLRELIQNAADASAKKVSIRFETVPSTTVPTPATGDEADGVKHVLLHHTLGRLLVSNDGEAFGENDWTRLKRIAEGNPDETKIGAFGVGFYSVFADCENPFVSSGDQTMAFYWKGNSLFTRRGRLPPEQNTRETCFVLDYRNTTSPVPNLLSICQFLSTSLTFVGLESVELWLDDWNLLTLAKKMAPSADVSIPKDINPKTKEGLMKIVGVEYQNAQIDAKWMNVVAWSRTSTALASASAQPVDGAPPTQSLKSFFKTFKTFAGTSSAATAAQQRAAKLEEAAQRAISENLVGTSQASVFLRISTVNVQTYVGKVLSAELERATKKPPPKHTKIAILTSSYDETSVSNATLSGSASATSADIFANVLPSKNGRIFIGFPTAQTTGLLAHISAPSVIPTVERESIDLNARYVRSWNQEMLRVAGIACRVAYTGEMTELKNRLARQLTASGNKKVRKEDLAAIMPAAVHAFNQYTYQESTPSSAVGDLIEEAFWTCNQKASISILSTRGVLPSVDVRVASEDLSFVDGIPVVPDELLEQVPCFFDKLTHFGILLAITTQDIKKELEAKALDEGQLSELLKWAAKKLSMKQLDVPAVRNLFDGTVVTISEEQPNTYPSPVLMLGAIDTFPNPTKIPSELSMPPNVIPFRFIKSINKQHLDAFGWSELQIVPWLRWILDGDNDRDPAEKRISKSPAVAAQILPVLSKSYDALSQSSKTTVVELLSSRTVIPTKLGMRLPSQAYFSSVKLFDDLPTVQGLQGVKEKFLGALGVRKTVELSVVFERLMASDKGASEGKWSHVDLLKYLVSVREDIPEADIKKLRSTPICPMEKQGEVGQIAAGRLYRISELYEPMPVLRDLKLPLLHWPEPFRKASPEAKFLAFLGLKAYPDVPDLVAIMSKAATNGDSKLYELTLQYLIANNFPNGYRRFNMQSIAEPFLPIQGESSKVLSVPLECFSNKRSAILGFKILREDLQPHAVILGVEQDPAMVICADRLVRNPPKTKSEARTVFGYFATRLGEIGTSGNLAEKIGDAAIVPITTPTEKGDKVRYVAPRSCFLGDSQTYGDIFDFVDFGAEANAFLAKVGSKNEPTGPELASMLVREPSRLLNTLGQEKYLHLLRRIAENAAALKNDKALWERLKKAPCLLAVKEVSFSSNEKLIDTDDYDGDDSNVIKEYHLAAASRVVIVNDFSNYRYFKHVLITAPQEEALEKFYNSLGAEWLSNLVDDDQRVGALLNDQSLGESTRKRIAERCRLFLHDHAAEDIRHDARWIEKTLVVKVVDFVTTTKRLKGYNASHKEKRTAALHVSSRLRTLLQISTSFDRIQRDTKRDATLYITRGTDYYDISRAIISLLLKRSNQQHCLALETILESDLRRLENKGYNVDRILRIKQAEERARIAEDTRQREIEAQQRAIAEEEQAYHAKQLRDAGVRENVKTPDKPKVPGAFDTTPEQSTALANQNKNQRASGVGGFFSNVSKAFGFETALNEAKRQINEMEKAGPSAVSTSNTGKDRALDSQPTNTPNGPGPESVTPTHDLQHNLISAIQRSRAHDSTTLQSSATMKDIKEPPSWCDSTPAQNLRLIGHSSPTGIKIFADASIPPASTSALLETRADAIRHFSYLLLDAGAVFSLPPQSLHVYYDESGGTIAFNSAGSMFLNLRYFLQLHWPGISAAGSTAGGAGSVTQAQAQATSAALVYWYVTLCHELAHNIVADHGSGHAFWTETFVMQYFFRVQRKCDVFLQQARELEGGERRDLRDLGEVE